jgi:mRNA-degrading endonuclease toxin of MazEF toxin-antitoxin module
VDANDSGWGYPRLGEIWLIDTPNQPDDPHQPRPGLIVSEDLRNRRSPTVIVVPVFSSGRPGPTRVTIRAGVGGIDHDSILLCEQLATLNKVFVFDGPLGGTASPSLLGRVNRAIRRALGEVVPEPS